MDQVDKNKPKWLRKLERESWQAELLISGVALFGTLQLPGLLEFAQQYLLLHYHDQALFYWFFALTYWVLFAYSLIILFLYHFIVRALWIGLIGLNSVYPDGFAQTALTSEHYQDQMRAEFGDIDGYIARLDRHASGIFGSGFAYAGIFLNLGVITSLMVILITNLPNWTGMSSATAVIIMLSVLGVVFTLIMLLNLLHLPTFRDREWVRRYHFAAAKLGNLIVYPLNHRYTVTSLSLISSQAIKQDERSTAAKVVSVVVFLVGLFFAGTLVIESGLIPIEFVDRVYFRAANEPTRIKSAHYADRGYEGIYFGPVVPSLELATDKPLEVWVPLPEREMVFLREHCSLPPVDDDLPGHERRPAHHAYNLACAKQYVEFFLDDQPLRDYSALREYRTTPAGEQFGVRFRFAGSSLVTPGQHLLKVVTQMPNPRPGEGARFREAFVPFYGVE